MLQAIRFLFGSHFLFQLAATSQFPGLTWDAGPVRLESESSLPLQLSLNGNHRQLRYQPALKESLNDRLPRHSLPERSGLR
jgi:hypothetical protein